MSTPNPEQPAPTPRTDRERLNWFRGHDAVIVVPVEIARELERELSQEREGHLSTQRTLVKLEHALAARAPVPDAGVREKVANEIWRVACESHHTRTIESNMDRLYIADRILALFAPTPATSEDTRKQADNMRDGALRDIADQKTSEQMTEDEWQNADVEGAYDHMIKVALAARAPVPDAGVREKVAYMKAEMDDHAKAGYGWGHNDIFAINAKVFKEFFDAVTSAAPTPATNEDTRLLDFADKMGTDEVCYFFDYIAGHPSPKCRQALRAAMAHAGEQKKD